MYDDCGLFLEISSPTQILSSPAHEVHDLVAKARSVDQLDQVVASVLVNLRAEFFSTFQQRVELIKSRSQSFQDHRITVYDKVLLKLTDNGASLENPAAITFFVKEFLGISLSATGAQVQTLLQDSVKSAACLTQALTPPSTQRGLNSSPGTRNRTDCKQKLFRTASDYPGIELAALAAEVDHNTVRLWNLYEQAKQDFHLVKDYDDAGKQSAAMFLRDTAENTLHYLRDRDVDNRLIEDLKNTFDTARESVEILLGRKRKFDRSHESAPPLAVQRGNSRSTSTRLTVKHGCNFEHHVYSSDRKPATNSFEPGRWSNGDENQMRIRGRPKHTPASRADRFTTYGTYTGHGSRSDKYRPPTSHLADRDDHFNGNALSGMRSSVASNSRPVRRPTQVGKGHSDVPYGYSESRPVDMYLPNYHSR